MVLANLSFCIVSLCSEVLQANVLPVDHVQLDERRNHGNIEGVAFCSRNLGEGGVTKYSPLEQKDKGSVQRSQFRRSEFRGGHVRGSSELEVARELEFKGGLISE